MLPFLLALAACNSPVRRDPPDRAPEDTSATGTDTSADTATGDTSSAPDTSSGRDTGSDCPAPPSDLVEFTLPDGYGHPIAAMMASGQIGAMQLPPVGSPRSSDEVDFGESAGGAYSPQPVTVELSISRCPGVMDTDATNFCNLSSTNGSFNTITYFARAYQTLDDYASVNARGYCWAPEGDGPYYVNMRWTYTACAYGASTCGFMAQLNPGPY